MAKRKKIKYVICGSCHICTSHALDNGYPVIMINGKKEKLSRVVYQKKYGRLKKGVVVRHKCDNPGCINIEHLLSGTQYDNIQDKVKRGRVPKGEKSHFTDLTDEVVLEMLKESNKSISYLSRKYKIPNKTISNILSGKSFSHLLERGYSHRDRRVKLSKRDKAEIRKSKKSGVALAKIYGVSEAMISIVRKK